MKYIPVIQCDFIDANGDRVFSLALIDEKERKTRAFINFNEGSFEKVGLTEPFRHKINKLKKLAIKYMERSTPVNLK
jgi:hypothetical protein